MGDNSSNRYVSWTMRESDDGLLHSSPEASLTASRFKLANECWLELIGERWPMWSNFRDSWNLHEMNETEWNHPQKVLKLNLGFRFVGRKSTLTASKSTPQILPCKDRSIVVHIAPACCNFKWRCVCWGYCSSYWHYILCGVNMYLGRYGKSSDHFSGNTASCSDAPWIVFFFGS